MTDIGAALAKIPSGIFILTARHGAKRSGMLASWIMQASFEPPMITTAVRKDRFLADWLAAGAALTVNILSDDEKSMISHFGRGFRPDEEAFNGIELLDAGAEAGAGAAEGAPIIADALAFLRAEVKGKLDAGDHWIFLAQVRGGKLLREGVPMTHIRKDGMKY